MENIENTYLYKNFGIFLTVGIMGRWIRDQLTNHTTKIDIGLLPFHEFTG